MQIRTRFAPSPTGYLHVGGARTALYCYLYARKKQGTYILRIEDTDRERSTDESIQAIFDALAWLGLEADEGPYYQTQRFDHYTQVAHKLLEEGKAYRCYCSKERLEQLRTTQTEQKLKPRYDGHCRDRKPENPDAPSVIRFRNPLEGEVVIDDKVYGKIVIQNQELDDLVIMRTDGTPTYNFTAAIDDWEMNITHVIRGDDHINNTPRQINILQALGAEAPIYAHVPMILGEDGKRLSKRHGAVSVMEYRNQGYLPESLLNYLVRLGWSHGDQEIFSMEEMINLFDIADINRAPAAFDTQKLQWLNQHYMKTLDPKYVAKHLAWHMQDLGIDVSKGPDLAEVVIAQRERAKTLREMAERSRFLYEDFAEYEDTKHLVADILPALQEAQKQFAALADSDWTAAALHQIIQDVVAAQQIKMGQLAQPLRVAVTGGTSSPPIDATLYLLGREKTLQRIERVIESLK